MLKKILIATLLLAGLTGCKSTTPEALVQKQCDENRSAIKSAIQDAERQTAMLGVIDDFEFQIRAIASDSAAVRKRYDAALRSYGTTDAELEAIQSEMASCLERLCAASKSHSLELRKQCSAAEWEQITAHYHSLKNVTYF
jgi:hypothetical protein